MAKKTQAPKPPPLPAGLRVLTVAQPWAWAICSGHKLVENRSWPTSYRGELLIHAGKAKDALKGFSLGELLPGVKFPADLPMGAIVGLVHVVGCHQLEEALNLNLDENFTFGPYCWQLDSGRPFSRPLPAMGKLGLWTPDGGHGLDYEELCRLYQELKTAPAPRPA